MPDISTMLGGESVQLLPERALYWPRRRTLLIADPHFGKAAAFRASGVPVPEATTLDNLARLDTALERVGAERLVVLGDLLHARAGRSETVLRAIDTWRQRNRALQVLLVRGNHDDRAGDPPPEWGIQCVDEPAADPPFTWCHEPGRGGDSAYVVAGHIHPAVTLSGAGGQSATLPCFYFGRDYTLLPAFGDFTGTAMIRPRVGERVFVVAEGEVVAV